MSINATPAPVVPFEVLQQCQVSRTGLVSLLGDQELMRHTVVGCLARVLLEIEQNQEDYRIFAIRDIVSGAPYSGFTNEATATTTLYVDLDLPPRLRGLNGAVFQLNSVSNSAMTQEEYRVWLQNCNLDLLPPVQEWRNRAARVGSLPQPRGPGRAGVIRASSGQPSGPAAPPAVQPAAPPVGFATMYQQRSPPNNVMGATAAGPSAAPAAAAGSSAFSSVPGSSSAMGMVALNTTFGSHGGGGAGAAALANPSLNASALPAVDIFDVPPVDQIKRQMMDDIRTRHAVFPTPAAIENMKTVTLRTNDRDLTEYIDKIKELLTNSVSPCVVCMDRDCAVVTLPCKHKVLCRLCATQVTCCPVCRETTVELFEPIEQ